MTACFRARKQAFLASFTQLRNICFFFLHIFFFTRNAVDCVLKRSKAIYDRVCREACRNPCEETTYDITLGYQGRESGVPFNGYYYLNMKLTIPVRYVAILKTIPMHTSTTVLAVIGGYLGFWLGLSMYSGVTKILLYVQAVISKRMKDRLTRASTFKTF
nr:uncharacterized protein LOC126548072 [Dermacentor andersoni]